MAKEEKTGHFEIKLKHGAFSTFFRHFKVEGKRYAGLDFSDISALRQLLSNEKARILWTLQNKKPGSLYELSKMLGRDFKSVRQDAELLRQFNLIRLVQETKGKRKKLRPVINVKKLDITISL